MDASEIYGLRQKRAGHDAPGNGGYLPDLFPGSLRFRDKSVETRFRYEQFVQSLPFIRVSLFIAALLYSSFGILDYLVVEPENLAFVWSVRYLIGVVALASLLIFSFSKNFLKFSQLGLSLAAVTAGGCILAMIAVTDSPANHLYYGGIVAVIFYSSTMLHLRFGLALCVCTTLFAGYLMVALLVNPIPDWALISNLFFLTMSTGVALFACYSMEVYLRQRFAQTIALDRAREAETELKDKAIQASVAKSEFLATMSHELRTPLNAIIGFSEVIEGQMMGPLGNDKYTGYAADIRRSGMHLLAIISDILDISKAESGKIELAEDRVDMGELLENVERLCSNLAREKRVRFSVIRPRSVPIVRGDERLLQQAVQNLVTNAIKFTPSAGSVQVWLRNVNGGCHIKVSDSGIGIAPEDQLRVFEPFVQVQSAFARDHGGIGLGLPLVKRIAVLHSGSVNLSSALSAGTDVTIQLPASRVIDQKTEDAGEELIDFPRARVA